MSAPIAIAAATLAALIFGISSVAEQRSTKRVKTERALSPRILLDLVRQPLWVTAIGGTVAGFALQVVALKYGPLSLVEPLLVCDLIFAVLITACLRRRGEWVMLAGAVATAAGVVGFLAIAHPSAGKATVSFSAVLPLAAGLGLVVAGCLFVAQRSQNLRPLALALACGVCYGVAAFLVKLVTGDFSGGLPHLLSSWPIYAVLVIGPVGFVLNQDAFQAEAPNLIAPVMSIITAADPLVSIALGYVFLNEQLSSSPGGIVGEVASLVVMVIGIVVIARHAPQVVQQREEAARRRDTPPVTEQPLRLPASPRPLPPHVRPRTAPGRTATHAQFPGRVKCPGIL